MLILGKRYTVITIRKLSIITLLAFMPYFSNANELSVDVKNNIPEEKQFIKLSDTETKKEIDLLSVSVRTVWPSDVKTVGQATEYILETIGYKLVVTYPAPSDAISMANKPIPSLAKIHRTMPIIDAIQLMIGLDNYVIVDHDHRLVSFSRKER